MQAWRADGLIAQQTRAQEIRTVRMPTVTIIRPRYLPPTTSQVISDNSGEVMIACFIDFKLFKITFHRTTEGPLPKLGSHLHRR